jgi:transketolase
MNKRFIQKGLTPFHEFGNITHNQWAQLVAKKTSPKALAFSRRNSEQAKKNKHHPRLGLGGYQAKQPVFRKMDAEAEAFGDPMK